jgi:hypothetical protein
MPLLKLYLHHESEPEFTQIVKIDSGCSTVADLTDLALAGVAQRCQPGRSIATCQLLGSTGQPLSRTATLGSCFCDRDDVSIVCTWSADSRNSGAALGTTSHATQAGPDERARPPSSVSQQPATKGRVADSSRLVELALSSAEDAAGRGDYRHATAVIQKVRAALLVRTHLAASDMRVPCGTQMHPGPGPRVQQGGGQRQQVWDAAGQQAAWMLVADHALGQCTAASPQSAAAPVVSATAAAGTGGCPWGAAAVGEAGEAVAGSGAGREGAGGRPAGGARARGVGGLHAAAWKLLQVCPGLVAAAVGAAWTTAVGPHWHVWLQQQCMELLASSPAVAAVVVVCPYTPCTPAPAELCGGGTSSVCGGCVCRFCACLAQHPWTGTSARSGNPWGLEQGGRGCHRRCTDGST